MRSSGPHSPSTTERLRHGHFGQTSALCHPTYPVFQNLKSTLHISEVSPKRHSDYDAKITTSMIIVGNRCGFCYHCVMHCEDFIYIPWTPLAGSRTDNLLKDVFLFGVAGWQAAAVGIDIIPIWMKWQQQIATHWFSYGGNSIGPGHRSFDSSPYGFSGGSWAGIGKVRWLCQEYEVCRGTSDCQ